MTPSTDFAIDPRTTNCDSDLRLEWPPAKIHLFGPLAPGMELRQPLPITIQQDPAAGFLASDEIFGVYGAGATWDAAQADYLDAFLEFHELLSSAADLPSRALLEHLETYLRRVQKLRQSGVPRKARDVKSALGGQFGFSPAPVGREKGHEWFALDVPGVARVLTMFSRGMPELSDDLMAKIARQLRVRRGYLDGMIDCTFSSEAYRKKLVDNPDGRLAGGGSRRP